jgi:hypothetical protein
MAANDFVHVVREDPARAGLLFAGTEHGLYISFDDGANWNRFQRNLPVSVQVADLAIKDNDLVLGTHGRSAYVMDNITQLRQLNPSVVAANAHLFDPVDAARGLDQGVTVNYYLKSANQKVDLEILDPRGNVIRSFSSADTASAGGRGGRGGGGGEEGGEEGFGRGGPPARVTNRVGVNRFTWDLRYPGPVTFPNMILWLAGTNGPRAVPGDYSVRLRLENAQPLTQRFRINLDPRAPNVTVADLQAQFDLAMQVRNRFSEANEGVVRIRNVKGQIDDRVQKANNDPKMADVARQLKEKLSNVEVELYQVRNQSSQDPLNYPIKLNNKLGALMGYVEGVEGKPTTQAYEVFGSCLRASTSRSTGSARSSTSMCRDSTISGCGRATFR